MTRARTGAVVLVGGGGSPGRGAAALAPSDTAVREFADGPLELAWVPGRRIAFSATASAACLVEGSIYEPAGESLDDLAASLAAAPDGSAVERRLPALRGDFWLLWWDRRGHHGIVASDQMGAGSPYWFSSGAEVVVASEVAELLGALRSQPAPDPVTLAHWLMCTVAGEGRTLFDGLRRLEAGHLLKLGARPSAPPRRWWLPRLVDPLDVPRHEAVATLRETVTRAVSRRIDDPLHTAVLLSGGLDSSAVAAFSVAAGQRPRAYSAVFPDHPAVDESALVALTSSSLGLHGGAQVVVRSGSVIGGALDYLDAWGVPPTTPNLFFWAPLLSQAGKDGTTVLLDGEGGDELFGLSPYLLADLLRRGRLRQLLARADGWPPPYNESTPARVRLRLRRFGVRGALPPIAHQLSRKVRGVDRYAPPWLAPSLGAAWLASEETPFAWKRLDGPRWWASLVVGVTQGPGPALVYEQSRRRAALAGIASRHPLVDVDVIELVLRLPPELAFDSRHSRPLLRESLAGLLPDEVRLRRHKSNFDTLFHSILAGRDLPVAAELLADPAAELRAFVDLDALRAELIDAGPPADPKARVGWAIRLWRLVTAECWLRTRSDAAFLTELRDRLPTAPGEDLAVRMIDETDRPV